MLNEKKYDVFKNILVVVAATIVTSSSFIININATPAYKHMYLLPLVHGIIMLAFSYRSNCMFEYPIQVIIYICFFVRNVITPIFLSGNFNMLKITLDDQKIVDLAILIMLYETFVVFLILSRIFEKKRYLYQRISRTIIWGNNYDVFSVIFSVLVLVLIILWIAVPEISTRYTSLFDIDNLVNIASNVDKDTLGSSERGLFTIGTMIFNICRYLISSIVLFIIRKKTEKTAIGVMATLVLFFLNMFFISTEVAVVFFIGIYLYFIAIKLWPSTKKILKLIFIVLGSVGIFGLAFLKSGMSSIDDFMQSIGATLQAYVPGIINIGGTLILPKQSLMDTLFADIYTIIPFRNTLFGLQVVNISDLFNEYNYTAGQIVPLLGESYYYFGTILSPLLSGIFAYFSIKIWQKMELCEDIVFYSAYSLAVIYLSVGICCYNFILVGQTFTSLIIPIFILGLFSHEKLLFKELKDNGE